VDRSRALVFDDVIRTGAARKAGNRWNGRRQPSAVIFAAVRATYLMRSQGRLFHHLGAIDRRRPGHANWFIIDLRCDFETRPVRHLGQPIDSAQIAARPRAGVRRGAGRSTASNPA